MTEHYRVDCPLDHAGTICIARNRCACNPTQTIWPCPVQAKEREAGVETFEPGDTVYHVDNERGVDTKTPREVVAVDGDKLWVRFKDGRRGGANDLGWISYADKYRKKADGWRVETTFVNGNGNKFYVDRLVPDSRGNVHAYGRMYGQGGREWWPSVKGQTAFRLGGWKEA